ncbi:30S ribosomal protein S16 [bacterium]|nr:30S ribosomal protein S16 [candidate division CSSED10-310 bacterium]
MATRIRLQRIGTKKNAYYRIVVADHWTAPTSKVVEYLGTYDPHQEPPTIKIDLKLLDEWLAKGATPTEKVEPIIRRARRETTAPAE